MKRQLLILIILVTVSLLVQFKSYGQEKNNIIVETKHNNINGFFVSPDIMKDYYRLLQYESMMKEKEIIYNSIIELQNTKIINLEYIQKDYDKYIDSMQKTQFKLKAFQISNTILISISIASIGIIAIESIILYYNR